MAHFYLLFYSVLETVKHIKAWEYAQWKDYLGRPGLKLTYQTASNAVEPRHSRGGEAGHAAEQREGVVKQGCGLI